MTTQLGTASAVNTLLTGGSTPVTTVTATSVPVTATTQTSNIVETTVTLTGLSSTISDADRAAMAQTIATALGVPVSSVTLTFNEPVAKGASGNVLLVPAVSAGVVTIAIASSEISVSGSVVTVNPARTLLWSNRASSTR